MRNIFLIGLGVWVCFVIEYFLSEWVSPWFRPNLLLILIVFFNLYRGVRHSLVVALFAGLLQDSFSIQPFGLNIVSFMAAAYLTTFLKMYIYASGSARSRLLLVFLITISYVLIEFWSRMMFVPVNFFEMFRFVMLPQVFSTTVVSLYVFKKFKQCASILFA